MGVIGEAFRAARGETARALTAQQMFERSDVTPMSFYDVTGDGVLRIIAAWAGTSLIADSLSSLTIKSYRRERGRVVEIDPPRWLSQPDDRISDFDWMHQAATSVVLRGNAYGLAFKDDYGRVREVEWQHPTWCDVDDSSQWLPTYWVKGKPFHSVRTRPMDTVGAVHVPGFIMPGSVKGLSPVSMFRLTWETARAAQQTARDWYSERAMPSSVLSSKSELAKGKAAETQEKVNAEIEPGKIMVIDGANWDWTPITLSPADMQFLDAIQATASQIAAMLRVEPEDVGGKASGSLKYSTVEGNQRKFNLRTLMAWARRFEQGLQPLMDNPETDFIRFDLDELARPDAEAQSRIQAAELNNGTLTLMEAREAKGRPPLTDAEIANWIAWYRMTKGAYADTAPLADVLSNLIQKGN